MPHSSAAAATFFHRDSLQKSICTNQTLSQQPLAQLGTSEQAKAQESSPSLQPQHVPTTTSRHQRNLQRLAIGSGVGVDEFMIEETLRTMESDQYSEGLMKLGSMGGGTTDRVAHRSVLLDCPGTNSTVDRLTQEVKNKRQVVQRVIHLRQKSRPQLTHQGQVFGHKDDQVTGIKSTGLGTQVRHTLGLSKSQLLLTKAYSGHIPQKLPLKPISKYRIPENPKLAMTATMPTKKIIQPLFSVEQGQQVDTKSEEQVIDMLFDQRNSQNNQRISLKSLNSGLRVPVKIEMNQKSKLFLQQASSIYKVDNTTQRGIQTQLFNRKKQLPTTPHKLAALPRNSNRFDIGSEFSKLKKSDIKLQVKQLEMLKRAQEEFQKHNVKDSLSQRHQSRPKSTNLRPIRSLKKPKNPNFKPSQNTISLETTSNLFQADLQQSMTHGPIDVSKDLYRSRSQQQVDRQVQYPDDVPTPSQLINQPEKQSKNIASFSLLNPSEKRNSKLEGVQESQGSKVQDEKANDLEQKNDQKQLQPTISRVSAQLLNSRSSKKIKGRAVVVDRLGHEKSSFMITQAEQSSSKNNNITNIEKQINMMEKKIKKLRNQQIRQEKEFQFKNLIQQSNIKQITQKGQLKGSRSVAAAARKGSDEIAQYSDQESLPEPDPQFQDQTKQAKDTEERGLENGNTSEIHMQKQRMIHGGRQIDIQNQNVKSKSVKGRISDKLYERLKHRECQKCANSKNKELASVYLNQNNRKCVHPQSSTESPLKRTDDPIERFYKLYVKGREEWGIEDQYLMEMDTYDLRNRTFTHHVTCPCANVNYGQLFLKLNKQKGIKNYNQTKPHMIQQQLKSKFKQKEAIHDINKMDSASQVYQQAQQDSLVHSILTAMYNKCDCRMRYKDLLLQRMRNQKLYHDFLKARSDKFNLQNEKQLQQPQNQAQQTLLRALNQKKWVQAPSATLFTSAKITDNSLYDPISGPFKLQQPRVSTAAPGCLTHRQSPCRRSCSTTHNPMFHCKLQDVKLRLCRPKSAQLRDIDAEMAAYDWFGTKIDAVVKQNQELSLQDQQSSAQKLTFLSQDLQDTTIRGQSNSMAVQSPNNLKDERRYAEEDELKNPDYLSSDFLESFKLNFKTPCEDSVIVDLSPDSKRSHRESISSPGRKTPGRISSIFEKKTPKEYMKVILQQLGEEVYLQDQPFKKVRILTPNEVELYYHGHKRINIRQSVSLQDRLELIDIAWNTLELLMKSLMLQREFEILNDSCKRKKLEIDVLCAQAININQNLATVPGERSELVQANTKIEKAITGAILKILVRLKKTYDAVEQVSKIIIFVQKRENIIAQFLDPEVLMHKFKARTLYYVILKLSYKIYDWIERLRVDHPLLNRPFVYGRTNLSTHIVDEQLTLRKVLLKAYTGQADEVIHVLDKNGKIIKFSELTF